MTTEGLPTHTDVLRDLDIHLMFHEANLKTVPSGDAVDRRRKNAPENFHDQLSMMILQKLVGSSS